MNMRNVIEDQIELLVKHNKSLGTIDNTLRVADMIRQLVNCYYDNGLDKIKRDEDISIIDIDKCFKSLLDKGLIYNVGRNVSLVDGDEVKYIYKWNSKLKDEDSNH